jgi:hypothetical protein
MKEQKPSIGVSAAPGVDAIQWTVAKLFQVSLHDLIFGSTTLKINDYPRQLALARMAAPPAVGYAVRVIERLLTQEPALGELLAEVERELQSGSNRQPAETEDPSGRRPH